MEAGQNTLEDCQGWRTADRVSAKLFQKYLRKTPPIESKNDRIEWEGEKQSISSFIKWVQELG